MSICSFDFSTHSATENNANNYKNTKHVGNAKHNRRLSFTTSTTLWKIEAIVSEEQKRFRERQEKVHLLFTIGHQLFSCPTCPRQSSCKEIKTIIMSINMTKIIKIKT